MANPEHLKILEGGVVAWNIWRAKNPDAMPDLRGANMHGANLREVSLLNADLRWADFSGADLTMADLSGANLRGANLHEVHLSWAGLSGANLSEAHLLYADLSRAVLNEADLDGADLFEADLSGAYLSRANLCWANLEGAHFVQANLAYANLGNARVGYTTFGNNDLSSVKGLDSIVHSGPSTIGIDTIYLSKGNIPQGFLRGAGVPEDLITFMSSLVGKPIEFYSCFISYSSMDDEFARRLHADLQQNKVRVWFAPEDLRVGDRFRTRFHESIRIYDKLMVILSTNSIQSPWVEEEVEAGFEKERKENKLVLFPIRLDDAVMDTHQAWAASLRRTRYIGDFRNWKDDDSFKKALDRLLRDLKVDKAMLSDK